MISYCEHDDGASGVHWSALLTMLTNAHCNPAEGVDVGPGGVVVGVNVGANVAVGTGVLVGPGVFVGTVVAVLVGVAVRVAVGGIAVGVRGAGVTVGGGVAVGTGAPAPGACTEKSRN